MPTQDPLHEVLRELSIMRAEIMRLLGRLESRADTHTRLMEEHTEADHNVFDQIRGDLQELKIQAALTKQAGADAGKRVGAGAGAGVAGLITLIVEGVRLFYSP